MVDAVDPVLTMGAEALDSFADRVGSLPEPLDQRLLDGPPVTDYERWIRDRVICDFCREDYKPTEPLWVRISIPCRQTGKVICATCISEIGFTGCQWYEHSRSFSSYIVNIFGLDEPPDDWDEKRPTWPQVAAALGTGPGATLAHHAAA